MMPGIPLPFVISLLLIILLVRLIARHETSLRSAIFFVGACTVLVTIVGLRWSFDIQAIRYLQPVIAAVLPPVAWFCFAGLTGSQSVRRLWGHAIPVGLVLILSTTRSIWHSSVDLVLPALFFGYGIALLRVGSKGPDELAAARLADAPRAHRATLAAGLALISSGAVDLLIAGDFGFYQGAHAALIVTIANMITLPLLAYAVAIVGTSVAAPDVADMTQDDPPDGAADPRAAPQDAFTPTDSRIVETVDRLMREKQLFRDPDLTLNRLARRAGIPARQISTAINRVFGQNVSQVVNAYRIEEAKRLLALSDLPVTSLMFEAGFQTKSNFNREFLRVAGMSPSDYRRSHAPPAKAQGAMSAGSHLPETR